VRFGTGTEPRRSRNACWRVSARTLTSQTIRCSFAFRHAHKDSSNTGSCASVTVPMDTTATRSQAIASFPVDVPLISMLRTVQDCAWESATVPSQIQTTRCVCQFVRTTTSPTLQRDSVRWDALTTRVYPFIRTWTTRPAFLIVLRSCS
jgi:hypothetical protein